MFCRQFALHSSKWTIPTNLTLEQIQSELTPGIRAMLKTDLPDAVISNDIIALSFISIVSQYGIRIPEDISIIGYDNIDESKLVNPPLTTYDHQAQVLAKEIYRLLASRIAHPEQKIRSISIIPQFIERKSCRRKNPDEKTGFTLVKSQKKSKLGNALSENATSQFQIMMDGNKNAAVE